MKTLVTIISVVVSLLMLMNLPMIMFFLLVGPIGEETVLQDITSPDGRYTAQLIDRSEGAMGGSTKIEVTDNDAFLFNKTQSVYIGKWGEGFDMEIYWKDNDTLVADGKEYDME